MKIYSSRGPGATQGGRGRSRASGSGLFSLEQSASQSSAAPIAQPVPASALDALLALQEVDDTGRRASRLRHGDDMLDRLDDLRIDLLAGRVPVHRLERLADGLRQRPARDDDTCLESVLDEIELRVHVELAKLGHAAA